MERIQVEQESGKLLIKSHKNKWWEPWKTSLMQLLYVYRQELSN